MSHPARNSETASARSSSILLGTHPAQGTGMTDVALSILALIAGGLTLGLFAASRPPLGHHEGRGFNLRTKALDRVEELQIGNPS